MGPPAGTYQEGQGAVQEIYVENNGVRYLAGGDACQRRHGAERPYGTLLATDGKGENLDFATLPIG
jgi:hypothetical protein